jgi:aspartate kinase
MSYVVSKFGGASVHGYARLFGVARLIEEKRRLEGAALVPVVSAWKGHTEELLGEIRAVNVDPPRSARDFLLAVGELRSAALLASALAATGAPAEVVPPWAVFRTDSVFGDATIQGVNVAPLHACLARGVVPVVPGFIGADGEGRLTTLGRGGSDYSAVAIGVALNAVRVELYKAEVDGVYDADPNERPGARRFAELTHDQALELARAGAKVLNAKAAELARRCQMPVMVLPTFGGGTGTRILANGPAAGPFTS